MRLLDLCCGAGGATKGYQLAGFHVTGVDINPQPNYCGDEFHQGDAIEFVLKYGKGFDFIHASWPCQAYTALTKGTHQGRGFTYPALIEPGREAMRTTGRPWVIENVVGAPVRADIILCGLMFGLQVFRHRLFEVDGWVPQLALEHPSHEGHRVAGWRHGVRYDGDMVAVYGHGGGKGSLVEWQRAMGIGWTSVRKEIAEAIPPAYTKFIGDQIMEAAMR